MAYVYQNQSELSDSKKKKDSKAAVAEYLASPRKKRKNFIVFAVSPAFDRDLLRDLRAFCRAQFPRYSIAQPKNVEELQRQFQRNLSLVIVDPHFFENESLEVIKDLKNVKKESDTKILFLTRDPKSLLQIYKDAHFSSSENDDYVDISVISKGQLFSRIKNTIDIDSRKKTRNFRAEQIVYFQIFDSDVKHQGVIKDLSIYGAGLKSAGVRTFSKKDQIVVYFPVQNVVKNAGCDILRISAKVKNIDIASKTVNLAWFDLSENKRNLLLKIISASLSKNLSYALMRYSKGA